MKIINDLTHITNEERNLAGDLAQPEQQTVSRILVTDAEVSGTTSGVAGNIPAAVVATSTVAEFARATRAPCHLCAHFDNKAFLELFKRADDPLAPIHLRETMNSVRAALLQTSNAEVGDLSRGQDGDLDVEHAIRSLGFCRALGEKLSDYVVVHPLTTCPDEVITATEPDGLYKPRDNAHEREGVRAYDSIMRRAQGKTT